MHITRELYSERKILWKNLIPTTFNNIKTNKLKSIRGSLFNK